MDPIVQHPPSISLVTGIHHIDPSDAYEKTLLHLFIIHALHNPALIALLTAHRISNASTHTLYMGGIRYAMQQKYSVTKMIEDAIRNKEIVDETSMGQLIRTIAFTHKDFIKVWQSSRMREHHVLQAYDAKPMISGNIRLHKNEYSYLVQAIIAVRHYLSERYVDLPLSAALARHLKEDVAIFEYIQSVTHLVNKNTLLYQLMQHTSAQEYLYPLGDHLKCQPKLSLHDALWKHAASGFIPSTLFLTVLEKIAVLDMMCPELVGHNVHDEENIIKMCHFFIKVLNVYVDTPTQTADISFVRHYFMAATQDNFCAFACALPEYKDVFDPIDLQHTDAIIPPFCDSSVTDIVSLVCHNDPTAAWARSLRDLWSLDILPALTYNLVRVYNKNLHPELRTIPSHASHAIRELLRSYTRSMQKKDIIPPFIKEQVYAMVLGIIQDGMPAVSEELKRLIEQHMPAVKVAEHHTVGLFSAPLSRDVESSEQDRISYTP